MHWNHRVVRRYFPMYREFQYGIHEVFYDDEQRMLAALDREALDYDSIGSNAV